jgi:5-methylcytosine-specific restriction endonuclease McrA
MHGARIETVDELRVYERDGWRCYLCGRKVNRRLRYPHPRSVSLDHVVPLVEGGEHSYANTRCTHLRCNLKKNCRGGGEQLALI